MASSGCDNENLSEIYEKCKHYASEATCRYYESKERTTCAKPTFPILQTGLESVNFVCGDVDFFDFLKVLDSIDVKHGEIFCDLGCGSGHCLAAAALFGVHSQSSVGFSEVVGVELMHSKVVECSAIGECIASLAGSAAAPVRVVEGNFLATDWRASAVVFACATCFTDGLMRQLIDKFLLLASGSRVVLLDKQLESYAAHLQAAGAGEAFVRLGSLDCSATWGRGVATMYRKA